MRKEWNDEEMKAAVLAYLEMLDKYSKEIPFVKKDYYAVLAKKFDRTAKSFEFRMENISYVFYLLGKPYIPGLKPKQNVGTKNIMRIERFINEIESKSSIPVATFESSVINILKSNKIISTPQGIKKPQFQISKVSIYARDAKVKAWILKNSNGFCEFCHNKAPFHTLDGIPFLEVHHIKQISNGGSDTITNTVALCPNCHREIHYGENRDAIINSLYSEISRLIKE